MEVQCINILFKEELLTNFSGFFNVETISDEGKVRMNESEGIGDVLLNIVTRIEHKFQPTIRYRLESFHGSRSWNCTGEFKTQAS